MQMNTTLNNGLSLIFDMSLASRFTSNDADYKNNIWDKGHLAPAAAFSDTEANLNATFSFLNCTLQHSNLNRYEWAQLEKEVRDWAYSKGDISVRIDVIFEKNHRNVFPN